MTTDEPNDEQQAESADLNAQQGPRRERADSDGDPQPETEPSEPVPDDDPVTGSPPVDPTPPSQQPKPKA